MLYVQSAHSIERMAETPPVLDVLIACGISYKVSSGLFPDYVTGARYRFDALVRPVKKALFDAADCATPAWRAASTPTTTTTTVGTTNRNFILASRVLAESTIAS